jgi:hypothetical protein
MSHTYKSLKDIAKDVRNGLKAAMPECTWSVVKSDNQVSVSLMTAPQDVFEKAGVGYHQVNHYYIDDDATLNAYGRELMAKANEILSRDHWTKARFRLTISTCSFYKSLSVGKWNKNFEVK